MGIKVNGVQIAGMGKEGTPGKSAYEYAREAGYTGTEEEFKIAMKNFGENFAGASGSDVFFYIDADGDVVPKTAEEMREIMEVPAVGENGAVSVENGGTGATTAEQARTSIGAEAIGTAAGLINRTTAVNTSDTGYTTLMARGASLNSAETTPAVNGAIAWTYE